MAEVIIRLERRDGALIAYGVDSNDIGAKVGALAPQVLEMLPAIAQPALDAVLFALRHGILQKLLKQARLPDLKAYEQAYLDAYTRHAEAQGARPDAALAKNAATLDALARVIFQTMHDKAHDAETGEQIAVDVRATDLTTAAEGVFTRRPEWDTRTVESEKASSGQLLEAASGEVTPATG